MKPAARLGVSTQEGHGAFCPGQGTYPRTDCPGCHAITNKVQRGVPRIGWGDVGPPPHAPAQCSRSTQFRNRNIFDTAVDKSSSVLSVW